MPLWNAPVNSGNRCAHTAAMNSRAAEWLDLAISSLLRTSKLRPSVDWYARRSGTRRQVERAATGHVVMLGW